MMSSWSTLLLLDDDVSASLLSHSECIVWHAIRDGQ